MMDEQLAMRIAAYQADYEAVTGNKSEHFFCPILLRDERTELCRGHVIGQNFGGHWVPQRCDVDHFYGSVIEAGFVEMLEDVQKDPGEIFLDAASRKRIRPKIELDGQDFEYYFHSANKPPVSGHSALSMTNEKGETICHFSIKAPAERLLSANENSMALVVDANFRPTFVAAALKAAHLTLFYRFGYRHVFSASGRLLADILGKFFIQQRGSHKTSAEETRKYFAESDSMTTLLLVKDDSLFLGSVVDNIYFTCFSEYDEPFILGVVVKAGKDRLCVFVPTDRGIDPYYSFLKAPPDSLRTRVTRFRPPSDKDDGVWELDPNELRLPLRQPIPPDFFD